MDQQHSALVKHIIKYFSCLPLSVPNLCPQPKSSLINHLFNVCCMLDQPSFRRRLNSSTSRTEF